MPTRPILLSLLFLATLLPPLDAQGRKEEPNPVIVEFKKYIRSPEAEVRKDQVERLARVHTEEAVKLLVTRGLTDNIYAVREKATWALSRMQGPGLNALYKAASHSKEAVREGVCLAIGMLPAWGTPKATTADHSPESTAAVALLGERLHEDRSPLVRSAAAEALGMIGNPTATHHLVAGLTDNKEGVIISAVDALGILGDPNGGKPLIPLLEHSSWRVQVAALRALGRVRIKEGVGPIIEYLASATGRPTEDARNALIKITQRTFGMNPDTWREWWERVEKTWTVPPEGKPQKEDVPEAGYGRKPTRYHRIPTYSKRIIFVIDISNSMATPILVKRGRESKKARPRLSVGVSKILLAREELATTLTGMTSDTWFNIIAFETDVRRFKKAAINASPGNIQAALRWIEKQKLRGTAATKGRPSSNVGKNGWILGKTNTYGALATVFGLKVDPKLGGVRSTTAPSAGSRKRRPKWDTCFFLSDGQPTVGVVTDIGEILQDVKRWNKTCKMIIHCIGMENQQGLATLLTGLARITGGQCVFVGK